MKKAWKVFFVWYSGFPRPPNQTSYPRQSWRDTNMFLIWCPRGTMWKFEYQESASNRFCSMSMCFCYIFIYFVGCKDMDFSFFWIIIVFLAVTFAVLFSEIFQPTPHTFQNIPQKQPQIHKMQIASVAAVSVMWCRRSQWLCQQVVIGACMKRLQPSLMLSKGQKRLVFHRNDSFCGDKNSKSSIFCRKLNLFSQICSGKEMRNDEC